MAFGTEFCAEGGQDMRAGQHIRHSGQEAGLRPRVDIDGLAGPSEVVIIADESADPAACAAEMLAQCEHDALASAVLITVSARWRTK